MKRATAEQCAPELHPFEGMRVEHVIGEGVADDPCRRVAAYYERDKNTGQWVHIWSHDPWAMKRDATPSKEG